ncbi:MAG: GGDEF domain-containing protein [Acidobacteriota bacterium]
MVGDNGVDLGYELGDASAHADSPLRVISPCSPLCVPDDLVITMVVAPPPPPSVAAAVRELRKLLHGGAALSEAVERAEDLRRRLAQLGVPSDEGMVRLTCSLGTGQLETGDTIDDLMKRADLALYRAKEEGRDRVATPPTDSWLSQRPRQAVSLIRSIARQPQAPRPRSERRKGAPPSDALLARISAVVDLLVASGLSEEGADRPHGFSWCPCPKYGVCAHLKHCGAILVSHCN